MIIALIVLLIVFQWLDAWSPKHLYGVIYRWARWLLFSAVAAEVGVALAWSGYGPAFGMAFLVWFVGETMFYWWIIRNISESDGTLFPRFRKMQRPESWPVQKRFLKLRDLIRAKRFQLIESAEIDFGDEIVEGNIRLFIFRHISKKIRLDVWFFPHRFKNLECLFVFQSQSGKKRLMTSNLNYAFGGFYPETYSVWRHLYVSFPGLLKRHLKHLRQGKYHCDAMTRNPIDDLNHEEYLLEQYNVDVGFLTPPHHRDDYGQLTPDGKFRVWYSLWLLNYVGFVK